MKTYQLTAEARSTTGKKAAKTLRKMGEIPAILYGLGKENLNLQVKDRDVRGAVFTPETYVIDLSIDGQIRKAILKEVQFHPVTDAILHVDFLEIDTIKPIDVKIPIVLEGHAAGVRAGGKLVKEMRKITVHATYDKIPERLTIDVSRLKLGQKIQIGDLHFEGLEIVNAKNAVVAAVRLTRAARGQAAAAAALGEDEEEVASNEEDTSGAEE